MENKFNCFTACYEVVSEKYHYYMVVKRFVSGAFAYGNRSAHTIDIFDKATKKGSGMPLLYDTRYDRDIPSEDLEKWCEYWKQYIIDNWNFKPKVELLFCDWETTTLKD